MWSCSRFGPGSRFRSLNGRSSPLERETCARGVEPRLAALRLLGQVRNSRPPSLPFGRLLCSPGFRLASSATGSASNSCSVRSMVVQVPWSGTCPPFRANKLRSLPAFAGQPTGLTLPSFASPMHIVHWRAQGFGSPMRQTKNKTTREGWP